MPNTGKPSPACHLCRKRRVNCDLTKPGCHRCVKIGKICPGYRPELDLLFRNQDKDSIAKKKALASAHIADADLGAAGRTRTPRPVQTLSMSSKSGPTSVNSGTPAQPKHLRPTWTTTSTICPQITEQWRLYSVPIILNHFSASINDSHSCGSLDFLPDVYKEINDESCLSATTVAFAKAYITNLSQQQPDKEQIHTYGHALNLTNAALRDPVERVKDSTLIAVWLLGIHEILISSAKKEPAPVPEAYIAHCQGLVSLLAIRGPAQFSSRRGRNVFWTVYMFILVHCMAANISGPPQSCDWFDLMLPHLTKDDQHAFAVANHNYRLILLCKRIIEFVNKFPADARRPSDITSILRESDILQSDVEIWNSSFTFDPTDLTALYVHNTLRAALFKLQYFTLLLVSHTDMTPISNFDFRQQHTIHILQNLSCEIIESIPLALRETTGTCSEKPGNWAGALRLVWPLGLVSWVPWALPEHRKESQDVLQRIGRKMGIRFAIDCDPPAGRFMNH
ncbi:uncharacterized protein LY89DRAFT_738414 [Mollisia scopiformis]|uniref:Zn(2)-C6 fungal-type domain-containing protein n=1 Tax=Mollisia scopiformis TaxID=149040 RepID=A0A194WYF6_MOLSC|nr:uncharacterized protein LY89DRAFT_738414 [Mollisia scopiformis]KUJ12642.1 hypothetical protein LY89DRAFT_738414 [Mollisia scopiformis]